VGGVLWKTLARKLSKKLKRDEFQFPRSEPRVRLLRFQVLFKSDPANCLRLLIDIQ